MDANLEKYISIEIRVENAAELVTKLKGIGVYQVKDFEDFDLAMYSEELSLKPLELKRFEKALSKLSSSGWTWNYAADEEDTTTVTENEDNNTDNEQKNNNQNTLEYQHPLDRVKMSTKLRQKLKRQHVVYDYPKTEKQQFVNNLFPSLFSAVYQFKQDGWPAWFKQERDDRWALTQNLKNAARQHELIMDPEVAGSRGLGAYLQTCSTEPTSVSDLAKIDRGLDMLEVILENLNKEKAAVEQRREKLFDDQMIIRKWAKKEQEGYSQKYVCFKYLKILSHTVNL